MKKVILLYRLKEGVTPKDFEAWTLRTDYPVMRARPNIDSFKTHRTVSNFFDGSKPDYDYVEVLEINDMDAFTADVGGPEIQAILGDFMGFAEDPKIIIVEEVA